MSLTVNNTAVENVIVNGKECNKVVCDGVTVFEKSATPIDPYNPAGCISFVGEEGEFALAAENPFWDGTIEYSTNASTWTKWGGEVISSSDRVLYLRGKGNTALSYGSAVRFYLLAKAGCYGNIQTLLQYDNPPTSVSKLCFYGLFKSCDNLTRSPELPATTLGDCCYGEMFYGCTGLTRAPELPAMTLAESCYSFMFVGCVGLTQAPELPATTLANWCYANMFGGCTGIKLSTAQDDTYKTPYRIPTTGTGTAETYALTGMFTNTGGTFTGTPEINITYYGAWD